MFLERIHIQNVKLIRDLEIDFAREDGGIRRWTVLIGRNGRGKTAILQAIALAAAGSAHVNDLGKSVAQAFPPRHEFPDQEGDARTPHIEARFRLDELPARGANKSARRRELPGVESAPGEIELESRVDLPSGYGLFDATSRYLGDVGRTVQDPLRAARARGLPYWMVAAYGVSRHLSFSEGSPHVPSSTELQLERMRSVFSPDATLRGIGFIDLFEEAKARLFSSFLQALTRRSASLLPEISNVELRGKGGVTSVEDLLEKERIYQRVTEDVSIKLPATWLSHGYQSSIAWLADLLGHFLIEDRALDSARKGAPDELQGLVLIDELDMHLHPTWQATFIAALRETFPNIQFIATTHSPLLLSGLRPDEIVMLELDEEGQEIVRHQPEGLDPRLMSGSELFEEFFEVSNLYANELGQLLDDYRFWANNPYRDDEREEKLREWASKLRSEGIELFDPVPRQGAGE